MPVPNAGLKVDSDNQKVKFLMIFGRPKTGIFRRFRGVPGGPNAPDMDTLAARNNGCSGSDSFSHFKPIAEGAGELAPVTTITRNNKKRLQTNIY